MGRKVFSAGSLSGAKSAMSGVSRSRKAYQDIGRAEDTVESIKQRLQQLEADFKSDTDQLATKMDPLAERLEQISIRPTKSNISVQLLALCWLPYWQEPTGKVTPAW